MSDIEVIKINNVSKKYCRNLRRGMLYGIQDIARNAMGLSSHPTNLRLGEFFALNGVTFNVKKGETLGIIGPNGSGKTTLLKLLNGIFLPDKGSMEVDGKVGALIEVGAGFHPLLTGRENIYINGAILGMGKKEIDEKFDEIVEFSGIEDFIDTPVKNYSSGMYVRLGFSIAIHCQPEILLIDEVLAVGDVRFQIKCFRKIAEFKDAGKTIVLVTHNMEAVLRYTDRVVLLDKGFVQCIDTPKNAVNKYLELASKDFESPGIQKKLTGFDKFEKESLSVSSVENIGDDKCPGRVNYNKHEFRYGNGKARIIDFELLNEEQKEIVHAKSKDAVIFKFKVKFYENIEKPVFAMTITTKDGIKVYGHNTLYKELNIRAQEKNSELWVEFRMKLTLQAGDYFFAAGVVESVGGEIIPLDRRYDLAHLDVISLDRSYGLVNIDTDIKVYN